MEDAREVNALHGARRQPSAAPVGDPDRERAEPVERRGAEERGEGPRVGLRALERLAQAARVAAGTPCFHVAADLRGGARPLDGPRFCAKRQSGSPPAFTLE